MAIQNSNLVLEIRCQTNLVKQGCDAVAGVLGRAMPEALSHPGRPTSPGLAEFEPTNPGSASYRSLGKRIGRSASLPGNPVRSRIWLRPTMWTTPTCIGIAGTPGVNRRDLSVWHERHQQTSNRDYPSYDRRDDRTHDRCGFVLHTSGK